jgi:hypothetical protein
MTLINEVKKTLCRTGIEMDATDVADHLARLPGRDLRPTRTQVAHALHALTVSDHDIIRTRPGLYRHQPMIPGPSPAIPTAPPVWSTYPTSPHAAERVETSVEQSPAGSAAVVQIIADSAYVVDQLTTRAGSSDLTGSLEPLTAYLLGIATAYLGPARLTWCAGPIPSAAELTRQQNGGRPVVAIIDPDVAHQAVVTACRTQTKLQLWTMGPAPAVGDAHTDEVEYRALDVDSLLAACLPRGPELISSAPTGTDSVLAVNVATVKPVRAGLPVALVAFESLWHLDVALYDRRVDGVTGHGNTHTLKRQALLLGRTYAERWSAVVTDEAREQLEAVKDQRWVPGRLYPDLLNFAEAHGLGVHGSQVIKDLLRRGFWQHVNGTDHDHRPRIAA